MKKRVQQTAKGYVQSSLVIDVIKIPLDTPVCSHGRLFKGGSPLRPSLELSRVQTRKQSSRVIEPFNEFLKTMRKPAAQDIHTHFKSYVALTASWN